MDDRITMTIEGYGRFTTTARHFERQMSHYLPGSVAGLRKLIEQKSGTSGWDGLETVTECLMVLTRLDGHETEGTP